MPLVLKGRSEPVNVFYDRRAVLPLAKSRSRVVRRSRPLYRRGQWIQYRDWERYGKLRRSVFDALGYSKVLECATLKRRKEAARRAERHQALRARHKGRSLGPRGPDKPVTRQFRKRKC